MPPMDNAKLQDAHAGGASDALAAFEFRGGPVFIQPLGDNDLMYVSFEEIK